MLIIRRILLYSTLIVTTILLVLWLALHFFAPNPTHRWYSSQVPDVVANELNVQDWRAAEIILAQDMSLPDNNIVENRQCFCNAEIASVPNQCNACIIVQGLRNYRIPDIVSNAIIADSKFYQNSTLVVDEQLRDFAFIASETHRSLWIFVPIFEDGEMPYTPQALSLVQSTGGNIVPYYVVDGYENRLMMEQAVNYVLIAFLVLGAGALAWAFIANNRPHKPSDESDLSDSAHDAESKIEETEEFIKRLERLSKQSKDNDEKKGKP